MNALHVGDLVQIMISAQVTGGANNLASQQNGIMQYVQDLAISTGGVMRVIDEGSQGAFTSTRAIQSLLGTGGDRGIGSINGYATSFTQGLGSATVLDRVTLQAIGIGSVNVTVAAASDTKFVASTPGGLKVGHTNNNGNPALVTYPGSVSMGVTTYVRPDFDHDGKVTSADLAHLAACTTGPGVPQMDPACQDARLDGDSDVDQDDFGIFQRCYAGVHGYPPQNCDAP